ncbi:hypothetical protein DICVIV_04967 [Dictyocaulus viviparus]|uniref:Uncharacterized protein n=1 Tax=Dictyocaulus viviparus TaxID=29172 RepID=A0A0D8XYH0_DICVI|nr:hypothetical protein DICVIV_04967 [Dictyocaulus viviparus]
MDTMHVLVLLFALLAMVVCQPFYGLEKQILYGFQDPDEIQWSPEREKEEKREEEGGGKSIEEGHKRVSDTVMAKRGGRLLNLIGLNSRFTDPFRQRMMKKKIRSVQMNNDRLHNYGDEQPVQ